MGKKINLIGQTFGKLRVIEEYPERTPQGSVQWKCRCECGNECIVSGDNLRRNHTTSCGCSRKEAAQKRVVDLTNQKFGKLLVIEKSKNPNPLSKCRHTFWKCKCDCGNITIVDGQNLKNNRVQSCGCIGRSKGEYVIKELLNNNKIKYETEKTFETCIFPKTNKNLRFDFYLPQKNILIEFDGFQHFYYTGYDWNTEENFYKTQERDNYKNQWCKENNILLIRIPYTHLNKLSIEDLGENSRFIIKFEGE